MICRNTKELLAEIKKYMDINDIKVKDVATTMDKSHQSVSLYFKNGNPTCNTIFEICESIDANIDIRLIKKSDAPT